MKLEALAKAVVDSAAKVLPEGMKETFYLRTFGLLKVPMLFYTSPSVIELTEERCVIKIPLKRRTKNHLHSMYFLPQ